MTVATASSARIRVRPSRWIDSPVAAVGYLAVAEQGADPGLDPERARSHFPTEQAALKCLCPAIMSLDPAGKGRKRWAHRWKAAPNTFDITFDRRLSAGRK